MTHKVIKLSYTKTGKVSVWFCKEKKFTLSQSCFLAFPLKKNQILSSNDFQNFVNNYYYFLCKEKALLYLSYREHSHYELKKKLLNKNFPKEIIQNVICELEKNNYLNENRLIKLIIDNFLNSNKLISILEVKKKLYDKRINLNNFDKTILKLSQEIKEKEKQLLFSYYAAKFQKENPLSFKKKHFPKLLRKGFSYDLLDSSFSSFLDAP